MAFKKNLIKKGEDWFGFEGTTDSGIRYNSDITGPDGAHFILYPVLQKHTVEDTKSARVQLRRERDVVSINTEWVDKYV